ncbi:Uncharacterised protein [Mycobacteroides abscessus subsp. abscessus]|nr:Uncharacterised protein [Mycobacteroides abscessus subsp. abscessus]
MRPVPGLTGQILNRWTTTENPLRPIRMLEVQPRQHPAGRPLEDLDPGCRLDQLRNDLYATGSGTDHRDMLTAHLVVMVPARTVNLVPGVAVEPTDIGPADIGQRSGCHHGATPGEDLTGGGIGGPHPGAVVECQPGDIDTEFDEASQLVFVDHALDIAEDLRAARVRPGPLRVLFEGIRVEQRRDIAGCSGVGVVAPGAADIVAALQDDKILDSLLQ